MVESLPHRTATADAPIAWIPRSVLEAIGRSAEYGHPHPVDGELFGYWIAPGAEVVVVDWDGFGSLMFREPYFASTDVRDELGRQGVLTPTLDAVRVPLGVWSTGPVSLPPSASEAMPPIHLQLERHRAWQARAAMLPCIRRPWDALRQPRAVELRVFSAPLS